MGTRRTMFYCPAILELVFPKGQLKMYLELYVPSHVCRYLDRVRRRYVDIEFGTLCLEN